MRAVELHLYDNREKESNYRNIKQTCDCLGLGREEDITTEGQSKGTFLEDDRTTLNLDYDGGYVHL